VWMPLLLGFMAFMIVRRVRMQLSSQRVAPVMMALRMLLLCTVGILLLVFTGGAAEPLLYSAAGLMAGLGVTYYALKHTRVEQTPRGIFYTPNRWIGLGISALIVLRLGTRVAAAYQQQGQNASEAVAINPMESLQRSPLTLAMFMLLAAYYVAYYGGVLWRSRKLSQGLSREPAPVSNASP